MNIISHKQVHPMRWKRRPLKAKRPADTQNWIKLCQIVDKHGRIRIK